MTEFVSLIVLVLLAYAVGWRRQKQKREKEEKEQADAFNDAIESAAAGGAAWPDRLRETAPVQRNRTKGGGPKKRPNGTSRDAGGGGGKRD